MSSAPTCGNRSGCKLNTIPGMAESVRLPSGTLFAFIPESCSESTRNAVEGWYPGNPFALARNPHSQFRSFAQDKWLGVCEVLFGGELKERDGLKIIALAPVWGVV